MKAKLKDKRTIKTILVVLLILALLLAIGHQVYYSFHLTPTEIQLKEIQLYRFKTALVIEGIFVVQSDDTVEYIITERDDAQLGYNLYVFYMEKEGRFPLYAAEDLWAEIPLDTWNPPEDAYIWNYAIWAGMQGPNLTMNWGGLQANINLYNSMLEARNLPLKHRKDLQTMTPEEIWRFSEQIQGLRPKMFSTQPITEADLID